VSADEVSLVDGGVAEFVSVGRLVGAIREGAQEIAEPLGDRMRTVQLPLSLPDGPLRAVNASAGAVQRDLQRIAGARSRSMLDQRRQAGCRNIDGAATRARGVGDRCAQRPPPHPQ
jgi:hypothetical protein